MLSKKSFLLRDREKKNRMAMVRVVILQRPLNTYVTRNERRNDHAFSNSAQHMKLAMGYVA